ncbi:hypothetical protein PR048_009813 [Dryococelus australis]|uniref:Uncharacterized protein n=1 Tax=Dryococelus australis TaxID=614101 RepID=A0ABQ9I214_9NEOP|nr:hypothetical protein PR048_009813 [Dryococelus australis]
MATLNCHFSLLHCWFQQQLQKTGTTEHIRGLGILWKGCSEYGNEGLHAWAIDYEQASIQPAGSSLATCAAVLHNIAVAHGEPLPPPPADEDHFMPPVPVENAAPRNNRGA